MAQDHHFLPQVYLRQWCVAGRLVRYRRVGPHDKLVADKKAPRAVGFEVDLYTLPVGVSANGLTGDEIESTLARIVDDRIKAIVGMVTDVSGRVDDLSVARDIIWLAQTFAARNPRTVRRVETSASEFIDEQRPMIPPPQN